MAPMPCRDREARSGWSRSWIRLQGRPRPAPTTSLAMPGSKVSAASGWRSSGPVPRNWRRPRGASGWRWPSTRMRWSTARELAANIGSIMGEDDGGAAGLAVAVTTSHQDWLAVRAPGRSARLRASRTCWRSLALHTAAISGFAFFAVRLAIAAWPWLALRVPGKKVAADGGAHRGGGLSAVVRRSSSG